MLHWNNLKKANILPQKNYYYMRCNSIC